MLTFNESASLTGGRAGGGKGDDVWPLSASELKGEMRAGWGSCGGDEKDGEDATATAPAPPLIPRRPPVLPDSVCAADGPPVGGGAATVTGPEAAAAAGAGAAAPPATTDAGRSEREDRVAPKLRAQERRRDSLFLLGVDALDGGTGTGVIVLLLDAVDSLLPTTPSPPSPEAAASSAAARVPVPVPLPFPATAAETGCDASDDDDSSCSKQVINSRFPQGD